MKILLATIALVLLANGCSHPRSRASINPPPLDEKQYGGSAIPLCSDVTESEEAKMQKFGGSAECQYIGISGQHHITDFQTWKAISRR